LEWKFVCTLLLPRAYYLNCPSTFETHHASISSFLWRIILAGPAPRCHMPLSVTVRVLINTPVLFKRRK
jgi:hypothetical protein